MVDEEGESEVLEQYRRGEEDHSYSADNKVNTMDPILVNDNDNKHDFLEEIREEEENHESVKRK